MRVIPAQARRIRPEHTTLLRALSVALQAVGQGSATARSLSDLGAIELPEGGGEAIEPARLQAAGPLYFASELENAGLLPTAERVAGLFASGAITQPLGPAARLVNTFWRARRERLEAAERRAVFDRVVEMPYFVQLMRALCEAIVAQADGSDLRERVRLAGAAGAMAEFLDQRLDPMAMMAAGELVANIQAAIAFLRDRLLQAAFGTRSMWQLVAISGAAEGLDASQVQRHVDLGSSGQAVLLWLARRARDPAPEVDPADLALIGAAQRWLDGQSRQPAATLPAAA
jgi:hypothetical protein